MGIVFRSQRVVVEKGKQARAPFVQVEAVADATEKFGDAAVVFLINRGLRQAFGRTVTHLVRSGATEDAIRDAQLSGEITPTKLGSTPGGRKRKSVARIAKEAVKAGTVSADELAAFLASKGVTA